MTPFEALLEVQAHDIAADQLRHRRQTLPERQVLARIENEIAAIERATAEIGARHDDMATRQRRLEDEIASIDNKARELDKKLYSGTVSAPRELQAMQADIESLKRHESELEDRALEMFEELEPLEAELADLRSRRDQLDAEAGALRVAVAEAESVIDAELAVEQQHRERHMTEIDDSLVSLYEQLRKKLGGVGAARLEPDGRCSGCHLMLPAAEWARIKRESPEALIRCDQCGRILVRAEA